MKLRIILALIADCFIICAIVALPTVLLGPLKFNIIEPVSDNIVFNITAIAMFLVYAAVGFGAIGSLYSLKDLAFRNASIGMRMMGLMILDKDFNTPPRRLLIKRNLRIFHEQDWELFFHGNKEDFMLKREYNKFGTIIVERKRFINDKDNYILEIRDRLKSDVRY